MNRRNFFYTALAAPLAAKAGIFRTPRRIWEEPCKCEYDPVAHMMNVSGGGDNWHTNESWSFNLRTERWEKDK